MPYFFYFYSSISAIALIVHLIINWQQLFGWRNVKPRAGTHEFRHFLVCLSIFFVADILWGILAALKYPRLLFADTMLFFLAMALSFCAWTRYVVAYLEMDGHDLVREIRADAKLSHLPVYLVTADVEARNQAESNGFTGILIKPITLEMLQPLFA